jgi:hypothetical protein
MEALLMLAAFLILGFAAMRWGHDSREGIGSKERELAAHGFSWTQARDR